MGLLAMKKLAFNTSGLLLILLMTFFIINCAVEPVIVDLPVDHPANPGAQESEFAPPPNPFQEEIADMEGKSEGESMMNHQMHKEKDPPHSGHGMGMGKERGSDSASTMKPDQGEGNPQHKEHRQ